MGQLVDVIEKPSSVAGVIRFELNRTLSGQGHEHFASSDDAWGSSPSDELARRMFATGQVDHVHVYSNIVTVDLADGSTSDGLSEIVRDLYQYWLPGVQAPSFAEPKAEAPAAAAEATAASEAAAPAAEAGADGEAAWAALAERIPADLLERSREARKRWDAKRR